MESRNNVTHGPPHSKSGKQEVRPGLDKALFCRVQNLFAHDENPVNSHVQFRLQLTYFGKIREANGPEGTRMKCRGLPRSQQWLCRTDKGHDFINGEAFKWIATLF